MPSRLPPHDLPRLPRRRGDVSKRDCGRVIVAGGAAGMAGAASLAASAALRSGAGLVEAVVPDVVAAIVAGFDPCVMVHGVPSCGGSFAAAAAEPLREACRRGDALAIGPGCGRTDAVRALVVAAWREAHLPAVFDADGLWALAAHGVEAVGAAGGPRILTPHAGELLRLLGRNPAATTPADRPALEADAADLAARLGAVVVFKGPGTFVTDGTVGTRNETGNPGMATAGTGDVLAGVIAALLAQGLEPHAAARLGAWVHGRAGDAAAADLGEVSMTARDLLDRLFVGFRAAAAQ